MRGRLNQAINSIRAEKVKWIIFIFIIVIIVLLLSYPLGNLILTSLYDIETQSFTFQHYTETIADAEVPKVLINTLKVGLLGVVFCILFAVPMAWGVSRTDMPFRKTIRTLVVLTFAMPSFLGAIGWILLLGPSAGKLNLLLMELFNLDRAPLDIFSFAGIIFCIALFHYPTLFFAVSSSLENMDASLEDAAQILGASKRRIIFNVTLPVVAPAITSGVILVFLESLVVFGIVIFLGANIGFDTITTKVFRLFSEFPPRFEEAATLSIPLFLVTAALLILQRRYLGKKQYTVITGKATQPQRIRLGPLKHVLCGYCLFIISLSIFLPSLALLGVAFSKAAGYPLTWDNTTLQNFIAIFSVEGLPLLAFRNSFILALTASILALFVTFVMSWIVERSEIPGRNLFSFIAMFSLSFPGVTLGISLVLAFSGYPLNLYGTLWIFVLAYFIKGLPLTFMYSQAALKQLGEELEASARIFGASWFQSIRDVTIPLIKRSLFSSGIIVFMLQFRDMPTSMFLYASGTEVISVLIYQYREEGDYPKMAAVAILLLIVNLIMVTLARHILEKEVVEGKD